MNRKSASPRNAKPVVALTAPNVLLAGIGAISLGRKQAIKSADEASERFIALRTELVGQFRSRQAKARKQIAALQKRADGLKIQTLRQIDKDVIGKLQPKLKPLRRQFERLVKQGEQQVKTKVLPAIRPVLAKVGIQLPKPVRSAAPARKPAAKRRIAKTVRKVARRRA